MNSPEPAECDGSGEIEIGTHQDSFGNWDTEIYTCPGCAKCELRPESEEDEEVAA